MCQIKSITAIAGSQVQGIFRIMAPSWHTTPVGELYCRCRIEDVTGSKIMRFLEPENKDFQLLKDQEVAKVSAHYKNIDGKLKLIGETVEQLEKRPHSIFLIPASVSKDKEALNEFIKIIRLIKHPLLVKFLDHVFWDMRIAIAFLKVPASYRHHHSRPGGLLTHSVDVAKVCSLHQSMIEDPYFSLMICAALLHDIGKIWTHNPDKSQSMRRFLNHEHLALEILAEPIAKLEME